MKVDPISEVMSLVSEPPQRFTNREKRDELAREVNLRKVVYPGQVRQGRMTQQQADRQRAIMQSIWEEFRDRVLAEEGKIQPQLDLSQPAGGDAPIRPQLFGIDPGAGDDQTTVHVGHTIVDDVPREQPIDESRRVVAGGGDGEVSTAHAGYASERLRNDAIRNGDADGPDPRPTDSSSESSASESPSADASSSD